MYIYIYRIINNIIYIHIIAFSKVLVQPMYMVSRARGQTIHQLHTMYMMEQSTETRNDDEYICIYIYISICK